jgi:signal peptidase I
MAESKITSSAKPAKSGAAEPKATASDFMTANRETIESIVVAIILALLFRAFIAEAFVIPTGSMAPTLMGRHVDVWCDECSFHYQASGSAERDEYDRRTSLEIVNARCPNCGYRKPLDRSFWSNENTFSGDRIIVSKTAYELGEPQRWDVIVFKYPQKAQQNFIKRLIGLPGEQVRISGGNVYVRQPNEMEFKIARKTSDSKLLALLQVVHDSRYPSPTLAEAGWPSRWQPLPGDENWESDDDGTRYSLAANSGDSLLRYRHYDPLENHWAAIVYGEEPMIDPDWKGRLVTDFYAYNSSQVVDLSRREPEPQFIDRSSPAFGQFWVDDLAIECEVEVGPAQGEVILDIVRAGVHHTCRIDATSGKAMLSMRDADGNAVPFAYIGAEVETVSASTSLRGGGTYRLRMTNVDHEVRLWVNGRRAAFDGPTTYASEELVLPDIDSIDGDLAPLGIGGRNQSLAVKNLRVLRDKYYVASEGRRFQNGSEYGSLPSANHQAGRFSAEQEISHILAFPDKQRLYPLLNSRRDWTTQLEEGQYMPLGDNSPASSDARYWDKPYVERHLLVGKAVFIYWPHTWMNPPFLPNFRRMQPIR